MKTDIRNERDMREALEMLLAGDAAREDTEFDKAVSILSFEEAGVLTRDEGLVLRMRNGIEFQITICRSR